jgi:hypothetical protein
MRYGGAYKSYGPQYVRGIQEMDGTPPGGNMWVSYSMNKEDIWVSKIPVPVKENVTEHINDVFSEMKEKEELNQWNIFSPLWCKVGIEKMNDGSKALSLRDNDPFDYAKAERVFPNSKRLDVEFSVTPQQNSNGLLEIEITDAKGSPGLRLMFDSTGSILTKQGYRNKSLAKYNSGETVAIKIELNTTTRFYTVSINGKNPSNNLFFAPLESVERIVFRTGVTRRFPDADTPTDQMYDLPGPNEKDKPAQFFIKYLKTRSK